jgi:hypothetical protein
VSQSTTEARAGASVVSGCAFTVCIVPPRRPDA